MANGFGANTRCISFIHLTAWRFLVSSLFARVRRRLLSMAHQLVDDSSLIGSGATAVQAAWKHRDARVARRIAEVSKSYPNTRAAMINCGIGALEPNKTPFTWPVPSNPVVGAWAAGSTDLEGTRLGRSVYIHQIRANYNFVCDTDTEGVYGRLLCFMADPNVVWNASGGAGGTWVSGGVLFEDFAWPVSGAHAVAARPRTDDPRFCCLYDSGIVRIGGDQPNVIPVNAVIPVQKEITYAPGIVWDNFVPTDVTPNLRWLLLGCSCGATGRMSGDTVKWLSVEGTSLIDFSNVQS